MPEPTDNIPMEWPKYYKGRLVFQRISEAQFRRRLREFAKFAVVQALNSTLDYDEIVDAWLAPVPTSPPKK